VFRTDNAGKGWTPAGGGPKNAAAIAVNPRKPEDVYVATAEGKLYRSTDGGARWRESD
jgi:photosystem II stability/assembly factor-like uncharacterized protein